MTPQDMTVLCLVAREAMPRVGVVMQVAGRRVMPEALSRSLRVGNLNKPKVTSHLLMVAGETSPTPPALPLSVGVQTLPTVMKLLPEVDPGTRLLVMLLWLWAGSRTLRSKKDRTSVVVFRIRLLVLGRQSWLVIETERSEVSVWFLEDSITKLKALTQLLLVATTIKPATTFQRQMAANPKPLLARMTAPQVSKSQLPYHLGAVDTVAEVGVG